MKDKLCSLHLVLEQFDLLTTSPLHDARSLIQVFDHRNSSTSLSLKHFAISFWRVSNSPVGLWPLKKIIIIMIIKIKNGALTFRTTAKLSPCHFQQPTLSQPLYTTGAPPRKSTSLSPSAPATTYFLQSSTPLFVSISYHHSLLKHRSTATTLSHAGCSKTTTYANTSSPSGRLVHFLLANH